MGSRELTRDLRFPEKFPGKNIPLKNFCIRGKTLLRETFFPLTVNPYKIIPRGGNQFDFEREGIHGFIRKQVEFEHMSNNEFNVGFGDLDDGSFIDDLIASNNGDLLRVFATVVRVMEDFLEEHPMSSLYFTGSTPQRTRIYTLILRRYYDRFSKSYEIVTIQAVDGKRTESPFDPFASLSVKAYKVKRKI